MSTVGSEPPMVGPEAVWWRDGHWQAVPDDLSGADAAGVVLAISRDEYPELSILIQYADDVDRCLLALGMSQRDVEALSQVGPFAIELDVSADQDGTMLPEEQTGMDA